MCSFSWHNLEISEEKEAEGAGAVQLGEEAERGLTNCVNICREGSEHGTGSSEWFRPTEQEAAGRN